MIGFHGSAVDSSPSRCQGGEGGRRAKSSAFCCSSASGLWLFTNWGRGMIMGLSYVAIPLGLVSMFPPLAGESSSLENTLTQLVSMGINAWMIFYLHGDYARDRFPADEKKGD